MVVEMKPKKGRISQIRAVSIRWIALLFLAAVSAHFFVGVSVKDYGFPLRPFVAFFCFGATTLLLNQLIHQQVEKTYSLRVPLRMRLIISLVVLILTFSLLFYPLYSFLFEKWLGQTIGILEITRAYFIGLFLMAFDMAGLKLVAMYGLLQSQEQAVVPKKEEPKDNPDELLVKTKTELVNLSISSIGLVFSSGGIVITFDGEGNRYVSQYTSIKEIEALFPEAIFFRANRQYLINKRAIHKLIAHENNKLEVVLKPAFQQGTETIFVSRYKSGALKRWFEKSD